MKWIYLLFVLFSIEPLLAADYEKTNVLRTFKDGRQFTFRKVKEFKAGESIYLYDHKMKTRFQAAVVICKKTSCLGKIEQQNNILNPKEKYLVYYTAEKNNQRKVALYYGTPLAPGVRFGYAQKISEDISLGLVLSHAFGKLSDIELTSNFLSLTGSYEFYRIDDLGISVVAELGYGKAKLDLQKDAASLNTTDNMIIYAASLEGLYQINNTWGISASTGVSKNTLSTTYSSSTATISNNPYADNLFFVSLGGHYFF